MCHIEDNDDEIVLQLSIRATNAPRKGSRHLYLSIDKAPDNKRILLYALKYMADQQSLVLNYLDQNIDLEELR